MYEYDIYNPTTKKTLTIFGYSYTNAFRKAGLNMNEWSLKRETYVD